MSCTGLGFLFLCCMAGHASGQCDDEDCVMLIQSQAKVVSRENDESKVRAAFSKSLPLSQWQPPAECGTPHTQDLFRPIKNVLGEHPGVDGHCYFHFAAFWINAFPTDPELIQQFDYVSNGKRAVEGLQNLPITCGLGGIKTHKGTGKPRTYVGDWGTVTSLSQDCVFYSQDDIYCYTLGWLKNQHLDSSLMANATAWTALGEAECDKLQRKYSFSDHETTVGYCVAQNSGPMHSHIESGTVTSRELARHVYPKCLMSGGVAGASEMSYCQALGCVLPGNRIGHAEECA
mmetsp:Transcript_60243/g.176083  ORF Transcript_60243/g.176083 Transcript_60243/m.176083 type:complete len:289 (-) Transcript_60243:111-977(-)